MNKLVYTGITCYLGQWHFTRGKQYDMYQHERSVYYIISDNDYKYYINKEDETEKPFCDLQKWRESQLKKIGV
jgi:hypothetical protein